MTTGNRIVREIVLATALAVTILSPGVAVTFAQSPLEGAPDLVGALKSTPGCLGVEAARTASGKQVIFAWFEDKKAVLNWFYSGTHQQVMHMFTPGASSGRAPLADVPDDSGPILAIASLTMTDKPQLGGTLPVSQIAIELYAPLPGGVAVGGRFAPSSVKVRGMLEAPSLSR